MSFFFFFFIITLQAYFLLHFQFLQWLKSRPLAALSACVYPLYSIINCFIAADYYFYNAHPATTERSCNIWHWWKSTSTFSLFKVVENICVNVGLLRPRLHNITSQHWHCSVRTCSSFIEGRAMSVLFSCFFCFFLCNMSQRFSLSKTNPQEKSVLLLLLHSLIIFDGFIKGGRVRFVCLIRHILQ